MWHDQTSGVTRSKLYCLRWEKVQYSLCEEQYQGRVQNSV